MKNSENIVKKLVNFTASEWEFIQNYKHANKLKTDMDVIRVLISQEIERKKNVILSSIERHSQILKKLADK